MHGYEKIFSDFVCFSNSKDHYKGRWKGLTRVVKEVEAGGDWWWRGVAVGVFGGDRRNRARAGRGDGACCLVSSLFSSRNTIGGKERRVGKVKQQHNISTNGGGDPRY